MPSAYSILQGMVDFSRLCSGRCPGQLVIQFTDYCNGACPQCAMNVNHTYPRRRLSREETEKIISWAASRGFRALSFTGGEPFLHYKDLRHLINYACRRHIPYIRTGTNGFFLCQGWDKAGFNSKLETMARELAASGLRNLWISVDSADATVHEQIRGLPEVINAIQRSLPIFHAGGIYPAANLGINRLLGGPMKKTLHLTTPEVFYGRMTAALERFFESVIKLGFTMSNLCYPMGADVDQGDLLEPIYGAHSPHSMVQFSREEKNLIFRVLQAVIPRYRSRIRIFTPLSSLYALEKQLEQEEDFSFPCRGGIDYFFVSARDAMLYPCGYRGEENMGCCPELPNTARSSPCRLCEWECFRDPSELTGPLMMAWHQPGKLWDRFRQDKTYARLWWSDLKYYRACRFFDGRVAPELTGMTNFV